MAPAADPPLVPWVSVSLDSDPVAARTARRHVLGLCRNWTPDRRNCAVLLTSELVTNAQRYGDGGLHLQASQYSGVLRVVVSDASPRRPIVVEPVMDRPGYLGGGRGLLVVEGVADRWGVRPRALGKAVWFELGEAPAPGASA